MEKNKKINYNNFKWSNETLSFEKEKREIIDFVSKNFLPTIVSYYPNSKKLDYTFHTFKVNKDIVNFKYDVYLDAWIVFANKEIVFNCYTTPGEEYIDERGQLKKLNNYTEFNALANAKIKDTYKSLLKELQKEYDAQQEKGAVRKLRSKTNGVISANDIEGYWTKRLTKQEKMKFFESSKKQIVPEALDVNDYFKVCKIHYEVSNKQGDNLFIDGTPKECYLKNSDGRYDEFDTVETKEDLVNWLDQTGKYKDRWQGGHPTEIKRSRTYLNFSVKEGKGHFVLSGLPASADELIKTYLEAEKQGINIELYNSEYYLNALKGNAKIRISDNYFEHGYPNENYVSQMYCDNLEKQEKKEVIWDEIKLSKINIKEVHANNGNDQEY
jgi:hypothetical protein